MSSTIEVLKTKTPEIGRPGDNYQGFKPGTTLLPTGHRKGSSNRPLPVPILFDRDIPIPTRDGTTLRGDVFRPANSNDRPVPAIMSYSPYGKSGAGVQNLSMAPGNAGVPESALSGYEKFEGPDPAEWVGRGYAIVSVDARGCFDSEGDIVFHGRAQGRDGHDAVEYVAGLDWCTGDVALTGNSWLAMASYQIAAEQPEHLKCFAPLEGTSDLYRETLCRGGVPQPAFWKIIAEGFSGRGQTEDVVKMVEKYPRWNEYWQDKRVDFKKIKVPAYILASFSTGLHTEGSCRCYQELETTKWFTIHATQEWYDLYSTKRTKELAAFFDHYLKGVDNGWKETPRVRASLLGYNQPNLEDVVIEDWPVPSAEYKQLYLGSNGNLETEAQSGSQSMSYQADVQADQKDADFEELIFRHTFSERTHFLGYSKAELYMSCPEHDDFDVFVQIRKADKDGNILRSMNMPVESLGMTKEDVPRLNIAQYLGPTGICRASKRELDPELSKPYYPVPSLESENKVQPGKIVKLDIGIWPSGIIFEKGEQLVLKVSGHPMVLSEFPELWGSHRTTNKGQHIVHFGAEYPSFVQVPMIKL